MIESQHYPRSQVRAEFHSVHQKIEFVRLFQEGKEPIVMNPEDCLSCMMKVLDSQKGSPTEPGLDAQQEGCQG